MGENRYNTQFLIPVLLAAGAAAALWYFFIAVDEPVPVVDMPDPIPEEIEPELPRHPMPSLTEQQQKTRKLTPLPSLDNGDAYFLLSLVNVFGKDVSEILVDDLLIEKFVASMDSLTSGHISSRIRPIGPVSGHFEVDALNNDQEYLLNEHNYRRYDKLVELFANGDLDELIDTYQRFYPLFQEAFVRLGYPKGYLNDRAVEVIDHLLDTPQVEGPIRLVRPHVLYKFADPELEALSSGQKMLLRMGEDHAAQVKQTLRQFRKLITESR